MIPGFATAKRRARSIGGKLLRQIGLLPGGVPNRLGEDHAWEHRRLEGDVLVFFPDTIGGLYQLRVWYGPLQKLHKSQGLTIVCMDSRTAAAIRAEIDTPVMTISHESFFDELVARSNVKLFLYVNYTHMNFLALRVRSAIHVSLMHGDSDKSVTVSNQAKAFDYSFVAGQAAIDRFTRYTALFDADARCIAIGRPQLDVDPSTSDLTLLPKERPTALYAPTWEGGHDTVSYSSVRSHGLIMVKSLVDAGFRVIYRPHPLIGQRVAEQGEADNAIRRYLKSSRGHEISTGRELYEDFATADILISDVSSVVNDWLATKRPVIVTVSAVPGMREASTKLLKTVPRIDADAASDCGKLAREHLHEDPQRGERLALLEYYLGDTTPGASLKRFLRACAELSELRDREWARISANEMG